MECGFTERELTQMRRWIGNRQSPGKSRLYEGIVAEWSVDLTDQQVQRFYSLAGRIALLDPDHYRDLVAYLQMDVPGKRPNKR